MRKFALLAAAVLAGVATPANAAYFFVTTDITAQAVETVTTYRTECGGIGLCSTTTREFKSDIWIPFDAINSVDSLDGIFSLSSSNLSTRVFGLVTLKFERGALLSSAFLGSSQFIEGNVGGNFTDTKTVYSAQNFSVNLYDTSTQSFIVAAPVPEPSAWAMMLLGFAAIGTALRRGKRQPALNQLQAW